MGDNLFDTFSFNVWRTVKEDDAKQAKNKMRRKKQIARLKRALKRKQLTGRPAGGNQAGDGVDGANGDGANGDGAGGKDAAGSKGDSKLDNMSKDELQKKIDQLKAEDRKERAEAGDDASSYESESDVDPELLEEVRDRDATRHPAPAVPHNTSGWGDNNSAAHNGGYMGANGYPAPGANGYPAPGANGYPAPGANGYPAPGANGFPAPGTTPNQVGYGHTGPAGAVNAGHQPNAYGRPYGAPGTPGQQHNGELSKMFKYNRPPERMLQMD